MRPISVRRRSKSSERRRRTWLYGSDGRDVLRGLGGSDMIWGLDGDDVLDGGIGSAGSGTWLDTDGDGMPDTYIPGGPVVEDNDTLEGGPGSDT